MKRDSASRHDSSDAAPESASEAVLQAFLVMDIQAQTLWAQEVLQQVQDVRSGQQSQWEISMNAYHLRVTAQYVEISPLFPETDPAVQIDPGRFESALQAWIRSIG